MPAKLSVLLATSILIAAMPVASAPGHEDGDLLVRLTPGEGNDRAFAAHGLTRHSGTDPRGWVHVRGAGPTAELLGRLKADRRIAAAEPNFPARASAAVDDTARTWTPSDPYLPAQWNLAGMPSAWYATRGLPSVVVAVLDTGLRPGSEAALNVLPGRDFVNGDNDPGDDNGHGTHIASILAQATDNGVLAAGVAPTTSLLPVKVLDAEGHGTVRSVADGIYWATDAGARVINLSLALDPVVSWSEALHDAVAYAAQRGVVLVGAAGNHGALTVALPASFNEVIAVGVVASDGSVPAYSNRGAALDLLAPGGDGVDRDADGHPDGILAWSFEPGNEQSGLYLGAGTSQAAAHVSGAAALLLALGESDRDRIRAILELTSRHADGSQGWTSAAGYGALKPALAVNLRSSVPSMTESSLAGWVSGQGAGGATIDWTHAAGAILVHGSQALIFLEDATGAYALGETHPDVITLWRLAQATVGQALEEAGGRMGILGAEGNLLDWAEDNGTVLGTVSRAGGLLPIIEDSGGLRPGSNQLVVLVDRQGGLIGLIEASGGVLGILEASGGLLGMLDASGGLMALVESSGGVIGLVDASGGFLGIVESAAQRSVLGTANGLVRY